MFNELDGNISDAIAPYACTHVGILNYKCICLSMYMCATILSILFCIIQHLAHSTRQSVLSFRLFSVLLSDAEKRKYMVIRLTRFLLLETKIVCAIKLTKDLTSCSGKMLVVWQRSIPCCNECYTLPYRLLAGDQHIR